MDNDKFIERLKRGEPVYLYDSFEEYGGMIDSARQIFRIKGPHQPEHDVPSYDKSLLDLTMSGDEITKEQYDAIRSVKDS